MTTMPPHIEDCSHSTDGHCMCWYDARPCCRCATETALPIGEGYPEEEEVWQRAAGAVCGDCKNGAARLAPWDPANKAWHHPGVDSKHVDTVCGASAIWRERTKDHQNWQATEVRQKYGRTTS